MSDSDPKPPLTSDDASPGGEEPATSEAASAEFEGRSAPYRFALRALVFLGLLIAALFVLEPLVMRVPLLRRVVLLENAYDFRKIEGSRGALLYLGDSVVGWGGDKEGRERVLPALAANASGLPVVDGSHPAYGPRCFYAQSRLLARTSAKPRLVLFGLSLASFGPRRAENPSWHFGLRRSTLESGHYLPRRALAVFEHGFGARSAESYANLEVVALDERVGRMRDLTDLLPEDSPPDVVEGHLRRRLLCDYVYPIHQSSEWPAAERLFASLAELRKTKPEIGLVVYLTPYDHVSTRRLLSASQVARIRANAKALVELARTHGIVLHDLSEALPTEAFDRHPGTASEHLFPEGREALIRQLQPALKSAQGG